MLITHQANVRAQMLYSACGFNRLGKPTSSSYDPLAVRSAPESMRSICWNEGAKKCV